MFTLLNQNQLGLMQQGEEGVDVGAENDGDSDSDDSTGAPDEVNAPSSPTNE